MDYNALIKSVTVVGIALLITAVIVSVVHLSVELESKLFDIVVITVGLIALVAIIYFMEVRI